ncbi:MAG: FxsA family protein [Caulobacteraceae bacterium]|nr:FxsA family protein [Caulobacter sp.]
MPLATRIKLGLIVWVVLEIAAFSLVADWIGLPRAILLGVITSLLGLILLRRAGTSAILKLRANFDGRLHQSGNFLDEVMATGGALALLLPGFLSDIAGLAMAAPALRQRAAAWVTRRGLVRPEQVRPDGARPAGRHGPSTIDLEPEEWRRSEAASPATKPWSP